MRSPFDPEIPFLGIGSKDRPEQVWGIKTVSGDPRSAVRDREHRHAAPAGVQRGKGGPAPAPRSSLGLSYLCPFLLWAQGLFRACAAAAPSA